MTYSARYLYRVIGKIPVISVGDDIKCLGRCDRGLVWGGLSVWELASPDTGSVTAVMNFTP